MANERIDRPRSGENPGRTVAWLAKQAELALASVDLSLSQYRILSLLAEGSTMSSALAERLAVRPPSVTAVIDGLVARGSVKRTHNRVDRRSVSLELTTDGLALLTSADAAVKGRLDQIAAGLGERASAKALASLTRWHDAMVAYRAARAAR